MTQVNNNYCTLYLIRHGQTDWNAKGLTQGQTDIPLNSEGIKQAQTLGESLKNIKFNAMFSSDLIRAKRTAEIIALERKLAIKTTEALRERWYGEQEGKNEQLLQKYYKAWATLSRKERAAFKPFPDYETNEELISRLIIFLREIAVAYPGKTILIVSHGGIIRAFLNHLSEEIYLDGAISNMAYIKLESDGVDFFIKEMKGVKKSNA
ncbi:histidine phosphatase family protein [Candidatus Daviesbacteria bacterium]|nr:histidine phosphatase family protein [Candidatus Daviesbacteria bacterium]